MGDAMHTPGPYKVQAAEKGLADFVTARVGPETIVLATFHSYAPESGPHGPGRRERAANAQLYSAAPALLAVLKEADDFIRSYFGAVSSDQPEGWSDSDARETAQQCAAAIAKAEGNPQ